jgi:hypothetical protein
MTSLASKFRLLVVTTLAWWSSIVDAHGYMKSPRSRNFVAYQDGVEWGGTASDPAKEYCPHCLNRGGGSLCACGVVDGRNYDQPKNSVGGLMGTNVQASYNVGATIEVEVVLTAHHVCLSKIKLYLCY